jgi:hypothetical protein
VNEDGKEGDGNMKYGSVKRRKGMKESSKRMGK